eukprot:CAMPEP_0172793678 /NCGR_PEP_ID=MMETSP1074-20121228/209597_1 /TAXON_ID=2916 /ORGANISM="Ceratium fusus, Strain PA161109" /LENGTH=386 /DNA_ID=CAMNT_0013630753 /DNA_START=39 /DNA_END=1200 /DNA_ORIENTATION=+
MTLATTCMCAWSSFALLLHLVSWPVALQLPRAFLSLASTPVRFGHGQCAHGRLAKGESRSTGTAQGSSRQLRGCKCVVGASSGGPTEAESQHGEFDELELTLRIGQVETNMQRLKSAQARLSAALHSLRRDGRWTWRHGNRGQAASQQGFIERRLGEHDEAILHFSAAMRIYEQAGALATASAVPVLIEIGSVHSAKGEHAAAKLKFQQALEVLEQLGSLRTAAGLKLLIRMGNDALRAEELDGAKQLYGKALALLKDLSAASGVDSFLSLSSVSLLSNMGALHAARGNHRAALKSYREAQGVLVAEALLGTLMEADLQVYFATSLLALGDSEGALWMLNSVRSLYKQLGINKSPRGRELRLLADAARRQADESDDQGWQWKKTTT